MQPASVPIKKIVRTEAELKARLLWLSENGMIPDLPREWIREQCLPAAKK